MIELVQHVAQRLEISPEQAEGAVGLLLEIAQPRLLPHEFAQLADAVPAISDVIGKAPAGTSPHGILALWSRLQGFIGRLGALTRATDRLARLGLGHRDIRPIASAVLSYFRAHGQTEVESALLRSWRFRFDDGAAEIEAMPNG